MDTDTAQGREGTLFRALTDALVNDERYPSCFDSLAQFRAWLQPAYRDPPESSIAWCEDCTPEYQAAMIEAGRCARPYVQFLGPWREAVMAQPRRIYWLHVAQMLRDGRLGDCPDV